MWTAPGRVPANSGSESVVSSKVWGRNQDGPEYVIWCRYGDALDTFDVLQETRKRQSQEGLRKDGFYGQAGSVAAPRGFYVPGFPKDDWEEGDRPKVRDALLYRFQMLIEFQKQFSEGGDWWDQKATTFAMDIYGWAEVELAAAHVNQDKSKKSWDESTKSWIVIWQAAGNVWDAFCNSGSRTPPV